MKLKEFIKKYQNKTVDYDKSFGGQCVDLFNQYLVDVYKINEPIKEFPVVSAFQLFDMAKRKPNFETQNNGLFDIPKEGDIIVWNKGVGVHGHVGICVKAGLMSLEVFEQNWNGVQSCVINKHNYKYITGFFRLKNEKNKK